MGAITFSLDEQLLKFLCQHIKIEFFVETGTFEGDTVEIAQKYCKKIYSAELSPDYFQRAKKRYAKNSNVHIMQGDSAQILKGLQPVLGNDTIAYWLDAHWCMADNTAGELSQCPLLNEIEAIGTLNENSIVMIDDARLFLAPPLAPHEISCWPSLSAVLDALSKLSSMHSLIILNDNFIFYPNKITNEMRDYAALRGSDWLTIADKSRDYDKLLAQLKGKDEFNIKLLEQVKEKDAVNEALKEDNRKLSKEINVRNISDNLKALWGALTEKSHAYEKLLMQMKKKDEFNHYSFEKIQEKDDVNVRLLRQLHEKDELNAKLLKQLQEKDDFSRELNKKNYKLGKEINRCKATVRAKILTRIKELTILKVSAILRKLNLILRKSFLHLKNVVFLAKRLTFGKLADFWKSVCSDVDAIVENIKLRFQHKLDLVIKHHRKEIFIPKRYFPTNHFYNDNLPSITIVTPSFNQVGFIEATLNSVLNQRYPKLEYIVQDGLSTDGTIEVLKKYASQLTRWESVEDKGQSHAINLGFQNTTGEIMAYLNSDDLLLPGTLSYVASYFAKHPDVDVVYGHRVLIDEEGLEVGRWVVPRHNGEVLSWADYVPQETLFWRRSAWEKVGAAIDESFQFAMDWDLLLRFRDVAHAKFARLPRFLGAFRVHSEQKSSLKIDCAGANEMNKLRLRCHGRQVTHEEINANIRPYLKQHVIHHKLYRLKLLQY